MNSEGKRSFRLLSWFLSILVVVALGVVVYRAIQVSNGSSPTVTPGANETQNTQVENITALEQQANAGDPQAAFKLANLYAAGKTGKPDLQKAAGLYRQAVDKGNADAMAALGELCQSGRLKSNGLPEAVELYQKAADLGSVAGQYNLAYLYEQGKGVPYDQKQAAKYYQLAAEGGDSLAQYDIGQRYALGVGVGKDLVEAFKWLTLALQNGQPNADGKMKQFVNQMNSTQIEEARRRIAAFKPRA